MVEAALVSPIFILLVFGVFEFGVAYRDVLTVGDATTDAARVGAIQGPDVTPEGETADYSIVNAVRDGLAGLKPVEHRSHRRVQGRRRHGRIGDLAGPGRLQDRPDLHARSSATPTDRPTPTSRCRSGDVDYFKCLSTSATRPAGGTR